MKFEIESHEGSENVDIPVRKLIIAGWAGRNQAAIEHHIVELEALGIKRPTSTPLFYRVSASRLSPCHVLENSGPDSSGEVEYFLIRHSGKTYVGAASDHTDRKAEAIDVTLSKQMCDKPCASKLWPLAEVLPHWDRLLLSSRITENGEAVTYQEGGIKNLLHPDELLSKMSGYETIEDGTVLLGGTLPVIGSIRPASRFEYQLYDPVLKRTIASSYDVQVMPVRA
ncbi:MULTISPECIES: DUF2848 domain-containing protein [Paenochrobactrum]|uniref:DUF2848 domain-containing protein n=1 Tax=Paenochrobactrum pullorum TaxID=1324351 RepID=UPI0035BC5A35